MLGGGEWNHEDGGVDLCPLPEKEKKLCVLALCRAVAGRTVYIVYLCDLGLWPPMDWTV